MTRGARRIGGCAAVMAALAVLVPAGPPAFAVSGDSRGTEYWLAFPGNAVGVWPSITLSISAAVAARGTVEAPGPGFSETFSVTPGQVTTVELPLWASIDSSGVVEDLGLHVTADREVSVYGLSRYPDSSDGYLALPADALGTEYLVMAYRPQQPGQVTVVGTRDGSAVTIEPPGGGAQMVALDRGQTYQYRSSADPTGTRVSSTQPVAVYGGTQCSSVPATEHSCSYLVEQLPPVDAWGRTFFTMPLATRFGDTIRVLASQDDTYVVMGDVIVATLDRGEIFETETSSSSVVFTSAPALVAQYANSFTADQTTGDPFMALIPPAEQALDSYTIATPASGFSGNYLSVVVRSRAAGAVTLDGAPIPAASYERIALSDYRGARVSIAAGSHRLAGPAAFAVSMYGFDYYDSYGYPGGVSAAPIERIASVDVSPQAATRVIGDEHCVASEVTDGAGSPVAGARVDFEARGANIAYGLDFTDESGAAEFCYTGEHPGHDRIVAVSGPGAGEASADWTACGEDGLDALRGSPADGAASGIVHGVIEPALRGVAPPVADAAHEANCAAVVPAENALDGVLPG